MSLINKMLQDLETRQEPSPGTAKPAYQGLHPTRASPAQSPKRLMHVAIILVALSAALYLVHPFFSWPVGERPAPSPKELSTRPVVAKQARAPVNATAATSPASDAPATPDAAVAISPASQVAATAAPAQSAPVPPSSDTAVAATTVPAPPALMADASQPTRAQVQESAAVSPPAPTAPPVAVEPKVAVAPNAHSERSPSVSPVGIVKPAEPPFVAAVARERKPADVKAPKPKIETALASSEESVALVDKKVRPLTAEETAEAGYRRGLRSLDQGRPDEALRQLRDALAAQPTHIKARELAAGIELQNGHWREAQSLLEEGLRQVSNHYLFARMLARVYVDHGAEAKALAVMESAAPQGSDDAEFSALLGLLYQRANKHTDAVRAYERAVTLRPNDGRSWLGFAISLEGVEQWSAAKNAYRRAQENELTPSLARYAEQRVAALKDR